MAGDRCQAGAYFHARFSQNSSRFPIRRLEEKSALRCTSDAALLPSGLSNWGLPWWERAPGALAGPGASANMAHMLYDSLLHEADVATQENITVVLGPRDAEGLSLAHELRRRLFAAAKFQPDMRGCFSHLYSYYEYAWSCDRHMGRYRGNASASTASPARLRSILALRRIAAFHLDPLTRPRTAILYGRSDTSRRRLLNASEHAVALQRALPTWRIVTWDRWSRSEPTLEAQIQLVRNAALIVTPHGAFPSVWGLFMRTGSCLCEIISACMSSWLPAHVMSALRVRHASLAEGRAHTRDPFIRKYRLPITFLDPRSGQRVKGCTKYDADPDLLVEPQVLANTVSKALEGWRPH
eukprot:3097636-Prymnesium_polylepis.1